MQKDNAKYSAYSNRNIVINELIGLKVKVVKSSDKKQKGTEGTVIDETKGMLVVSTNTGIKKLQKTASEFRFYAGARSFLVSGEEINFRPDERTEKALRYYKMRKV